MEEPNPLESECPKGGLMAHATSAGALMEGGAQSAETIGPWLTSMQTATGAPPKRPHPHRCNAALRPTPRANCRYATPPCEPPGPRDHEHSCRHQPRLRKPAPCPGHGEPS